MGVKEREHYPLEAPLLDKLLKSMKAWKFKPGLGEIAYGDNRLKGSGSKKALPKKAKGGEGNLASNRIK